MDTVTFFDLSNEGSPSTPNTDRAGSANLKQDITQILTMLESPYTPGHRDADSSSRATPKSLSACQQSLQATPDTPLAQLLKGVVAYVEVRSKHENRSGAVERELRRLGAQVENKLSKNVTHVLFKEGRQSTWNRAHSKGLHVVSVLWIESCKEQKERVAESLYPASLEENTTPIGLRRQRKYKSMQPKDFSEELADSLDRSKRRKQQQSKSCKWKALETPVTPLMFTKKSQFFVAETQPRSPGSELDVFSPSLTIPDTPPSMRAARQAQMTSHLSPGLIHSAPDPYHGGEAGDEMDSPPPASQTTIQLSIPLHRRLFSGGHSSTDNSPAPSDRSDPVCLKSSNISRKADSPKPAAPVSEDAQSSTPEEITHSPSSSKCGTSVSSASSLLSINNLVTESNRPKAVLKEKGAVRANGKRKLLSMTDLPPEKLLEPVKASEAAQTKGSILDNHGDQKQNRKRTGKKKLPAANSEVMKSKVKDKDPTRKIAKKRKGVDMHSSDSEADDPQVKRTKSSTSPRTNLSKNLTKKRSHAKTQQISTEALDTEQTTAHTGAVSMLGGSNIKAGKKTIRRSMATISTDPDINGSKVDPVPCTRGRRKSVPASSTLPETTEHVGTKRRRSAAIKVPSEMQTNEHQSDYPQKDLTSSSIEPAKPTRRKSLRAPVLAVGGAHSKDSKHGIGQYHTKSVSQNLGSSDDQLSKQNEVNSLECDVSKETEQCTQKEAPLDDPAQRKGKDKKSQKSALEKCVHPRRVTEEFEPKQLLKPEAKDKTSKGQSSSKLTDISGSSFSTIDKEALNKFKKGKNSTAKLKAKALKLLNQSSSTSSGSEIEGCDDRKKPKGWKKVEITEAYDSGERCQRSLVMTSLHFDEQDMVRAVVKRLGGFNIQEEVGDATTHVICGSNRRTLNVLHIIAKGGWLLSLEWVLESLEAGRWIGEEPFEQVDFFPAAQISRMERQSRGLQESMPRGARLFSACGQVYVAPDTCPPHTHLVHLLQQCGAQVTQCVRKADVCIGKVFKPDVLAVTEKWVLDSITAHKSQPFENYKLP